MSRSVILVLVCLLAFAGTASASTLDVNPVRIHLTPGQRSVTLSLTNRSSETQRYQVTAHTWRQSADGEMELAPTEDLIFFPSLLKFAPGEARRVKIATTAVAPAVERSYRIFLEPLATGPAEEGAIRIVTRIGIPVFVQPARPRPDPALGARVQGDNLQLEVTNRGNSYFRSRSVHVVGLSADGRPLIDTVLEGWYVLAQGRRSYTLPLSPASCRALASVTATLRTEHDVERASLTIPPGGCSR